MNARVGRIARAGCLATLLFICSSCDRASPPSAQKGEEEGAASAKVSPPPRAAHASQPERKVGTRTPPSDYTPMTVGGVTPTPQGNAVVLVGPKSERGMLIFISGTEALSIALRLQKRSYARPLTHDLLDGVMRELGGKVLRAQVDDLKDGVFYGTLLVDTGKGIVGVDSRPSDALALALGSSAPVYVAEKVLDEAGLDLSGLDIRPPEELEPESQRFQHGRGVEL